MAAFDNKYIRLGLTYNNGLADCVILWVILLQNGDLQM